MLLTMINDGENMKYFTSIKWRSQETINNSKIAYNTQYTPQKNPNELTS